MKAKANKIPHLVILFGSVLIANGCSSVPGKTASGKEIAVTGPTVMNVQAEPSTVELNRNLLPNETPRITADVKDFKSKVTDVKLRFTHVPLQVPMEKVGGTTWQAELSTRELQSLAVSGKVAKYEATIVARDESGQTAVSRSPITIAVKTPDLAKS